MKFDVGEYVLYAADNSEEYELGRVLEHVDDDTYRVCYSSGCTAALTHTDNLYKLRNGYVIEKSWLGFHRFDETCDSYDPEVCDIFCSKYLQSHETE